MIIKGIAGLVLLCSLWLGLLATVMATTGAAPAALVPLPSASFLAALPDDVAIVGRSALSVTLAGPSETVSDLYAAGAWLVLPAGLSGCSA
ncbi:MAG: hypothetical protein AAGA12_08075 [Pseudomonadota bacterium]